MKRILFMMGILFVLNVHAQNVGIGTTFPAAKLEVKSTGSFVAKFDGIAPMYLGIYENDLYRGYWGSYAGNPEDVDFGTGASNATGKLHLAIQAIPKMTINNLGNIGINTTSPDHRFHINGGDLFVESSSGGIRYGYNNGNQWEMVTIGGGADLRWVTTTDGGTTKNYKHYWSQNGDVGIGGFSAPVAPLGRLDVIGAGATSATNTFLLRKSNLDTVLRMRDDGRMGIGYNNNAGYGRTLNIGGGANFYNSNEGAFGGAIFPTDTSLVVWSNSGANNYLILQPSWGNTGIGTYSPNAKLHLNGKQLIGGTADRIATGYDLSVHGKIIAEEVKVQLYASWPDYVFGKNYKLLPLEELEQSINKNKHLPNIPSAADVEKDGISLGDMNKRLMEKVEELTLYIIDLNKKNNALAEKVQNLEDKSQPNK